MLRLTDIRKNYVTASETVEALKGINLAFRQNEFVSILGPSGCGKTTLLNIIGGLDHYTSGDLMILGRSTKEYRDRDWDVYRNHRVGFIFQSYNLIPHQTVLGNVELALTIAGIDREERIARAKRALDRVGLSGQYYKRPNQLSGGQCQRVAIARALVNDPEILLADEPTGALDTVTSKQIMELIREISGERLVIMVTHNPEIAEEYSTRIIRLRDGEVSSDSNPYNPDEEEKPKPEIAPAVKEEEPKGKPKAKRKKEKREKAKMSFFTAFKLSFKNLLSKKGRTTMVGIAGSIGIIGIALVLAFSSGIKGYIASMQDDMLSGNPIEIAETGFNSSAVTSLMNTTAAEKLAESLRDDDKVYINSVIANLAKMSESLEKLFAENTITEEYMDYVKAMPDEYYEAIIYNYGFNLATNIFTDFTYKAGEDSEHISIKRLVDMYSSVLKETDYAEYSAFIPYLVPSMSQAPNSEDYILSQYELLGDSRVATGEEEIMLVLNANDELSDLLLAAFGYYTQEEFLAIVDKATSEDKDNYNNPVYRDYFEYNELLGKEFVYYPNDKVFTSLNGETNPLSFMLSLMGVEYNASWVYNSSFEGDEIGAEGIPLKVVGILSPKENVSFGSLNSGIYYTEAFANKIIDMNKNSLYLAYLMTELAKNEIGNISLPTPSEEDPSATTTLHYSTVYSYTYLYDDPTTEIDESYMIKDGEYVLKDGERIRNIKSSINAITPSSGAGSAFAMSPFAGASGTSSVDYRDNLIRNLGGNSLPNHVLIYPKSFDEKTLVTDYLDRWNESKEIISVGGVDYKLEERTHVTYTDTLELVINMITTMIDVITYALVAFTSVSLVVSTVMIGIITYVSVVERIKEIGVIRALGGRKRDVRHLFNAETFIIGLLSGLIGVGATYLISIIVNIILKPLIGYSSIAALPVGNAIILIILSVALTCISGLIPASSAAKKDPVVALRTE